MQPRPKAPNCEARIRQGPGSDGQGAEGADAAPGDLGVGGSARRPQAEPTTSPGPTWFSSTAATASSTPPATPSPSLGIEGVAAGRHRQGPGPRRRPGNLPHAGRQPFQLPPRDPVLYFVQRLRDEAHRFAIGSHRQRRSRDIREAGLQEIAGIGPTRKRALLRHFGTLKAIERASIADLTKVPGVNADIARRIYDFFHGETG